MWRGISLSQHVIDVMNSRKKEGQSYDNFLREIFGVEVLTMENRRRRYPFSKMEPGEQLTLPWEFDSTGYPNQEFSAGAYRALDRERAKGKVFRHENRYRYLWVERVK